MDKKNQQNLFMDILYHNFNRMSRVCISQKKLYDITGEVRWCDNVHQINEEYCIPDQTDAYTSLSVIGKNNRTTENVIARTGFYVDIDCHHATDVEKKVDEAREIIKKAYDDKTLSTPTMIIHTGRGLGIYYVLDQPVYISSSTVKMQKKFDMTYEALIDQYKQTLKDTMVDVDTTVTDSTRVCRIPGTYNTQAKKFSEIIYINQTNDQVQYVKDFKQVAVIGSNTQTMKKRNPNVGFYDAKAEKYMLGYRMEALEKLVDRRVKSGEKLRQNTAFIYYNCAIQIMNREDARKKLFKFNEHFAIPLQVSELNNIIRELERAGSYRFRTEQLISKLEIDAEEANAIGISESNKSRKRAENKKKNKEKRQKRNESIRDFLLENPDVRIVDIAAKFNVGRTTINNIIKEYGINRYNKEKTAGCIIEYGSDVNNVTINEQNKQLADSMLELMREKIVDFRMKLVTNYYDNVVEKKNIKSMYIINAIAMLADMTEADHYGWEIERLNDIGYICGPSLGEKDILLLNQKYIRLNKLAGYICKKSKYEEITKNIDLFKDIKCHDSAKDLKLFYQDIYIYRKMAENIQLMNEYIEYVRSVNYQYVDIWKFWEKITSASEYEPLKIFYYKLLKTNQSVIKKFIDYAMSACTTTDISVNIQRICKYFRVRSINEIILPKLHPATKAQRENGRKYAIMKHNNQLRNKYVRDHEQSQPLYRHFKRLRSKCYDDEYITICGVTYDSVEMRKLFFRIDIDDLIQMADECTYNEHDTYEHVWQIIIQKMVEIINKKEYTSNWMDRIVYIPDVNDVKVENYLMVI